MLTWYTFFKFVHVMGTILWLGGIITLSLIGSSAGRTGDAAEIATVYRHAEAVGQKAIGPGSISALISGIVMMGLMGWSLPLWMGVGFAGYAGSFIVGGYFTNRSATALTALRADASADPAGIAALNGRVEWFVRANLLILVLTVAAMVIKPTG